MSEYIEREAALKAINRYGLQNGSNIGRHSGAVECAIAEIEQLPAADVAPVVHGEWLPQIPLGNRIWDCSECKTIGSPQWKRCPVCEAKMDGNRQQKARENEC